MKNRFERLSFRNLFLVLAPIALLFSFGCNEPQTATPTNTSGANTVAVNPSPSATAAAAANTPTPPSETTAQATPVTLPALDAMFADENFAGELKSKLQLTDEQVDKLKTAAHEAVAGLKEEGQNGSTRGALNESSSQIKQIVGDDKAQKLFALLNERSNGGAPNAAAATTNSTDKKPNQIPTDTRVVVNAPAYRMDLFQDGKLVKTYKIGIGYPEFPLPTAMRTASEIIFNPTWTPPDEPWVEASKKVKAGQKVAAGDKLNPLGPIKIPIGAPSLIHGGKSPAKLGGFASHGCVGLTNSQVQDFAANIAGLSGTKVSLADVKSYAVKKTETKSVKLGAPVAVELRYETIVVEDGTLKIFRDVYEKGTNTEANLRAVLDAYGVSLDSLNEQQRKQILDGLKQMALDAGGAAVNTAEFEKAAAQNKKGTSKNPTLTRVIKGKKEISFDIAELKGKGYPAPVNFSQQ